MSVMRVHKNKNFSVMSNYHFREKKMTLKAKGLLSLMLSLPDDWDYSVSGLTTLSKDGRDAVMAALKELEQFGYLTRERVKLENGQYGGIEYNIYEEPQMENAITEKSTLDNSTLDNPISEKPLQLNTNSIKDLNNKLFMLLSTKDVELLGLYQHYIQVRENMNAPLTEIGLEKLVARAKKLSKDSIKIEKILLETAIINNWKNIYPPRESEIARMSEDIREELINNFGLE